MAFDSRVDRRLHYSKLLYYMRSMNIDHISLNLGSKVGLGILENITRVILILCEMVEFVLEGHSKLNTGILAEID